MLTRKIGWHMKVRLGQTCQSHRNVYSRPSNEGLMKVHEDFTIMEKASTGLLLVESAFTFKTLLRHYAEQALTPQ